ncbi:glycine betaine ABC transporter substrate-binding protein [Streptomyces sp. NPDC005921]
MMPGIRIAALVLCSFLALSGCADGTAEGTQPRFADHEGPIVIGTDGSPQSRVVAALYGELLTAAGHRTVAASGTYASPVDTAQAVVDGRIDIAPAYETTLLRAMPGC